MSRVLLKQALIGRCLHIGLALRKQLCKPMLPCITNQVYKCAVQNLYSLTQLPQRGQGRCSALCSGCSRRSRAPSCGKAHMGTQCKASIHTSLNQKRFAPRIDTETPLQVAIAAPAAAKPQLADCVAADPLTPEASGLLGQTSFTWLGVKTFCGKIKSLGRRRGGCWSPSWCNNKGRSGCKRSHRRHTSCYSKPSHGL